MTCVNLYTIKLVDRLYNLSMKRWLRDAFQSMPGRAFGLHIVLWIVTVGVFIEIIQSTIEQPSLALLPITTMMFGLHEMAHAVTGWLPAVLTAAMGSVAELALPLTVIFISYHRRAYVTTFISTAWIHLSTMSVGRYIADAQTQRMPLVSIDSTLNEDGLALHDWNFVLGKLGLLEYGTFIGTSFKLVGIALAVSTLITYAYCIYLMTKKRNDKPVVAQTPSLRVNVVYRSDPINKA